MKNTFIFISILFVFVSCGKKKDGEIPNKYLQQAFVHPGMLQNTEDLELMRNNILQKKELWLHAFNNLKAEIDTSFIPKAFNYISVGPYGTNSIGGKEFSVSAKAAYNYALMWYITHDKIYAKKAIEILNAWSYRLWGFDGNNAKLNVGLLGHYFLNAAEILRYTNSGWKNDDVEQFERLVITVFYPTIKDFFAEANGNWDASIIATMLCIGVFTDNHKIFNRAVNHYYRGEGNGGITKYIYPGGQCQETIRDWDHVQLGIGEFSKAAQVAWTQGIDLYSVADDRLAQGFEYTAKVLSKHDVVCFGDISKRDKNRMRDIYESIYKHYSLIKGINLVFSKQIIDKYTRAGSSTEFLTATRHTDKFFLSENLNLLTVEQKIKPSETGALLTARIETPSNAIRITPGENIQSIVDRVPNAHIILNQGVHVLNEPLKIRSGITLAGEGRGSVLILNENIQTPTIVNATMDMQNVIICDLLIEGATKSGTGFDPNYERTQRLFSSAPSREGISFMSDSVGKMKNILLENITVQNFTKNGILVSGAENVRINHCNADNNGSSVVPGQFFHHNLRLTRSSNSLITNSRFDSSLWGCGVEISFCNNILIENNECARNRLSGIYCLESRHIDILSNLLEGNDEAGIKIENLKDGCINIDIGKNLIQYNAEDAVTLIGENEINL
ncbi:MAG: alginate lyase family protein [Paludibacteraceae bacterium]